jgi:1-aminocyclopropane-1-carboxylate deaminase
MQFRFVSREEYRLKSEIFLEDLNKYGDFTFPGGTNELAIKAVGNSNQRDEQFNYICCPVGTGGTISELLTVYYHIKSFRISCFKGTFKDEIRSL